MHHIVIIHGIGRAERGYSQPLVNGLKRAYAATGKDASAELTFHEVVWDDLVAVEQARLANVLREGFGLAPKGTPAGLLSKILGAPKRLINGLRTDFAASYVEDVLSYRDKSVYAMIHERVGSVLAKIAQTEEGRLSVIAHSLGSVVASDHIYDAQKNGRPLAGLVKLRNIFTLGSPIALFALQYGGVNLFKSPIRIDDPDGVWLNIYDKDDPIAYPLKTLNEAYGRVVNADIQVNTGWFGLAHIRYFDNRQVQHLIAQEL